MIRRFCLFLAFAFVGCADGLTPPKPTELVHLAGTGSADSFRVGSRDLAPCGRLRVENDKVRLRDDDWAESERIVHEVAVEGFCMDRFEVTVEQYRHCYLRETCPQPQFTNAGNDFDPGFVARYWSDPERYGQHPVVGVTWEGAQAYCAFRGGQLPTEIQWEYAAQSRGKALPVTTDPALVESIDGRCENANHNGAIALGACSLGPHAVGLSRLDRTRDGIHDLLGNVTEWTADQADLLAYCEPGTREQEIFLTTRDEDLLSPASDTRLRNSGQECLTVGSEDSYVGACMEGTDPGQLGFEGCYSACLTIEEDGGDGTSCLLGCFTRFEECASACLADGVVTVCAQRSDKAGCFPQPWCVPQSNRNSGVPHRSTTPNRYIVRGGHFQTKRACEARVTRRQPVLASRSTLGFRCVFPEAHPRCLSSSSP